MRVLFSKPGYEPYVSRVVPEPPPETELNVPLISTVQASVSSLEAKEESVKVTFDRPILEQDIERHIQVTNNKT